MRRCGCHLILTHKLFIYPWFAFSCRMIRAATSFCQRSANHGSFYSFFICKINVSFHTFPLQCKFPAYPVDTYLFSNTKSKPPVERVVGTGPIRAYLLWSLPKGSPEKSGNHTFTTGRPLLGGIFYAFFAFSPVKGSTNSLRLNWSFAISSCS